MDKTNDTFLSIYNWHYNLKQFMTTTTLGQNVARSQKLSSTLLEFHAFESFILQRNVSIHFTDAFMLLTETSLIETCQIRVKIQR